MFINYAHRGASHYAPENTMAAFRKALEMEATGIELDLQQTKDEKKEENIERKTLEIIKKYAVHNHIYITSFQYSILENIRKLNSNIKISWLIEEKINSNHIVKLLKIKGNQICPEASRTSKEDVKLARENGLSVRLWGVYNEEIMKKTYILNTDGMTVNFPDKLNQLMKEKENEFEQ